LPRGIEKKNANGRTLDPGLRIASTSGGGWLTLSFQFYSVSRRSIFFDGTDLTPAMQRAALDSYPQNSGTNSALGSVDWPFASQFRYLYLNGGLVGSSIRSFRLLGS
jgi:hypothetical protein